MQPLPLAVLTYLAVGGPRDRDHLAAVFWQNNKNRLNSLSTTLNRIRAEVPGAIEVEGNTLVGANLASDVGDLRTAIDGSDFAAVTDLYRAAFLGSLKLRGQNIEFEEWVLEQRTALAGMVELALLEQGRRLYDAGEFRGAVKPVEYAWEIALRDGFPSPDYFELYHRVLASGASPVAQAVRTTAGELGISLAPVEPAPLDSPGAPEDPVRALSNEHLAANGAVPLFGCVQELAAIASSVNSQRVTTVVGLGGSGKTRLTTEFFNSPRTTQEFPRRHWVNLRDVRDHGLVAQAIAAAAGQRFDTVASLADSLADDEPALVVLDNFEHVLQSAGIVEELAEANPRLRVLITSRVPLEIPAESLIQLTGLDISERDEESPAEQLFVSSARRVGVSDDRLRGPGREIIRDVCRQVGGNPLALEIAGGWTQLLSPAEILDALSADNELLGTSMVADLRSMETVLQQSWATLGETEQQTLMLLATFRGGCLTKEALKLRELPIRSIGQLVQHSLARLQVEGRITLHPLIAGHALTELNKRPGLRAEYQQVLSTWCQSYSTKILQDSTTTYARAFEAEVTNFVAAWSWDAAHGLWDLHRATLPALRQFFTESGRVSEGRALFAEVGDALRSHPTQPTDVLVEVLEALGWFEVLAGNVAPARAQLEKALELSHAERPHTRAQILRTFGALQLATGDIDEAAGNYAAGLALIADEPGPLTASLQYDLAQAHHYRGDREQARSAARLALRAGRESNNDMVMGRSYLLLADIEVATDPQRAIVLLNEGWEIANNASLGHIAMYFPHVLGLAHLSLGEAKMAERYFADGMRAATDVGHVSTLCANYVGRAEARLLRNDAAGAAEDLQTGIRLALKTNSGRYLLWAAVVSCRAAATRAPADQTMDLLARTMQHPAADQDALDKAVEVWEGFFADTPLPSADRASGDEADDLDEIAERALELLHQR